MPLLAVSLLASGRLGLVALGDLPLLGHALMPPAMLVPMLLSLDVYTGAAHGAHKPFA